MYFKIKAVLPNFRLEEGESMSIFNRVLSALSGNGYVGNIENQRVLNKVIGFRGISNGCGTSTIVQSVVQSLSETTNLSICVVDMNMLFPVQQVLLGAGNPKTDIMEYDGDVGRVTMQTRYRDVSLARFHNRTIIDMIGDKDKAETLERLFKDLRNIFDVIIVDLSHDKTNMSAISMIKCNKIFSVTDMSLKSIYHIRTVLNMNATLAVSVEKQRSTILNKSNTEVISGIQNTLKGAGLEVIAQAPYCPEVAKRGISGLEVFSAKQVEHATHNEFNTMIKEIVQEVIKNAPDKTILLEKRNEAITFRQRLEALKGTLNIGGNSDEHNKVVKSLQGDYTELYAMQDEEQSIETVENLDSYTESTSPVEYQQKEQHLRTDDLEVAVEEVAVNYTKVEPVQKEEKQVNVSQKQTREAVKEKKQKEESFLFDD